MFQEKKLQARCQAAVGVILFLAIVVFVITACAPSRTTVTPSPISSPTQSQPPKTSTPFATSTLRPTMTIATTATSDILTTLVTQYNVPLVCLSTAYLESRNQEWIATDCKLFQELVISSKAPTNKFTIPYQEIYNEDPNTFSIIPLSWSSDSQYFYFTTRCCTLENNLNEYGSLYEFDTDKNTWKILVRADEDPYYFFSENGERYISFNNHIQSEGNGYQIYLEIGMAELSTRTNKRFVLQNYEIKRFEKEQVYVWSKDGNKFALIIGRLNRSGTVDVVVVVDFIKNSIERFENANINDVLN